MYNAANYILYKRPITRARVAAKHYHYTLERASSRLLFFFVFCCVRIFFIIMRTVLIATARAQRSAEAPLLDDALCV